MEKTVGTALDDINMTETNITNESFVNETFISLNDESINSYTNSDIEITEMKPKRKNKTQCNSSYEQLLKIKSERLDVEKERLKVETERLSIEKVKLRISIEKLKEKGYDINLENI